jgi:hypothetical protein
MNNLSRSDQNQVSSPVVKPIPAFGIGCVAGVIAGAIALLSTALIAGSILSNCDAHDSGIYAGMTAWVFGCPSGILLGGVVTFILAAVIKKRSNTSAWLITVLLGIVCGLFASAAVIAYLITYQGLSATNC